MGQESPALNQKKARAALLVAEDDETDEEIAKQIRIARSTLDRWKNEAEFQAAVQRHIRELGAELSRYHIARKEKRIEEYNARWKLLQQVRKERAAAGDPDIPGMGTGLVVRQFKQVGAGYNAKIVEEYAVDTGTLAAELALEKQASQEAGQWTEKRALTDAEGNDIDLDKVIEVHYHRFGD